MSDDGGIPRMRPVSADDVREKPRESIGQQALKAALAVVTMIGTTILLTVFHVPASVFYAVGGLAIVAYLAFLAVRSLRRRRRRPRR